ncbi:HlyD family efflux transporter periplasmic adaptor subunit [Acetobacterium fimetarium]|uniref:HlyD family efflux transporter periplasmic adaptor subunit n=1 Tax=Acetobacterium fimetarium TaxID=52691 RepID=A0ABR6WU45_9FIRM|nr:efflux RND transporter periplasmic adaptor subunit [Acetobacterium fimetarium]MBC3804075.1 HlyD family efflux transporter periplasmic adaptor subunit [Acetobacterium fimetarium]
MKKKGIILCIVLGLAIVIGGGAYVYAGTKTPAAATVKTSALAKGNLQNSISATGIVESNTKVKVSDSSGDTIEKIYVAVGDAVSNGDWLCQLYNKQTDTYTNVKAGNSGTITAVSAVKGAMASGELFTIEDTSDLKVRGKVKEANLNLIHVDMPVTIKSDATGAATFQGNLSKIAPTAMETKLSADSTTKNAEFEIEVDLPADVSGLKIGMTTRLSIVSEEKNDVFSVPFEALVTDDSGKTCIYIAQENPDKAGTQMVAAIPVSLGMETDSLVEIAGDQLTAGMAVISQPQAVHPGDSVSLEEGATV